MESLVGTAEIRFQRLQFALFGKVSHFSEEAVAFVLDTVPVGNRSISPGEEATILIATQNEILRGSGTVLALSGATLVVRTPAPVTRDNLRRSPRVPVSLPGMVRWRREGTQWGPWQETRVVDLAYQGIAITAPRTETTPCDVDVNFQLPPERPMLDNTAELVRARGRARAVRLNPAGGCIVGVSLVLSAADRLKVAMLCDRLSAGAPPPTPRPSRLPGPG